MTYKPINLEQTKIQYDGHSRYSITLEWNKGSGKYESVEKDVPDFQAVLFEALIREFFALRDKVKWLEELVGQVEKKQSPRPRTRE